VSLVLGSRAPNPIEIGASRLRTTKSPQTQNQPISVRVSLPHCGDLRHFRKCAERHLARIHVQGVVTASE